MQTVFKITLPTKSQPSIGKPFVPRKAHKKSRGGCLSCKQRRIRCDENKPSCGKCKKSSLECLYPTSPGYSVGASPNGDNAVVPVTANMHLMAVEGVEAELSALLGLTSDPSIAKHSISTFNILQHFQTQTALTIGTDQCKAVFNSVVVRKAWDHAFLMHMLLAVSAAHLKRLHADSSHTKLYRQYASAEAAHWQYGLQLYRQILQRRSPEFNPNPMPDFDATLATVFLSTIFTFALDDETPVDAYWGKNEDKFLNAISPLAATTGFRVLTELYADDIPPSCWLPVLITSDDANNTFSNGGQAGIDGLPPAFVELCELNSESTAENNGYHHIVRHLAPLLTLERSVSNFTKLMAFGGRTWPYLRPLIYRRDPRGLLLTSYWFALLSQLNQWWMTQRAESECMAIVHYLSQLQDPKINALLPFPTSFGKTDLSYIWDCSPVEPDAYANIKQTSEQDIRRNVQRLGVLSLSSELSASDPDAST